MDNITIPLGFDLKALCSEIITKAVQDYIAQLPPPDPWLTIAEAAAYANMNITHMRRLVKGRPYRAGNQQQPERPAVKAKIPHGDTGFTRGLRVRQSAVDKYLTRHAYRKGNY